MTKRNKLHCWMKERVQVQAGSDLSKHVPRPTVRIKTTWHVSKHKHHYLPAATKGRTFNPATAFSLLPLLHDESSVAWHPAAPQQWHLGRAWRNVSGWLILTFGKKNTGEKGSSIKKEAMGEEEIQEWGPSLCRPLDIGFDTNQILLESLNMQSTSRFTEHCHKCLSVCTESVYQPAFQLYGSSPEPTNLTEKRHI